MHRIDHALCWTTSGLGFGGAIMAETVANPQVTGGAISLAALGLASLIARGAFSYMQAKLDTDRLRTEIEVYRRLCSKERRCPFTPDGTPACALPDAVDREIEKGGK